MNLSRLGKLIVPTGTQLAVCLALSLTTHFLVFQSIIFARFSKASNLAPYLNTGKQIELSHLSSFAFVRLAVQGIFWAVVGLCAYVIYLALVNAVVEARNEVVVSTEFANRGQNHTWFRTLKWQLILLGVLLVSLWLTAVFAFDFWFATMAQLVIGGVTPLHIVGGIFSLLGLAANIYLLWILAEAAVVADR